MQLFKMHRFGKLNYLTRTNNQCKEPGHPYHTYEVMITCENQLDRDKFIIDHVHIDRVIQKIEVSSCEDMCLNITTKVRNLLKRHAVKVKEIHVILKPDGLSTVAYMELITKY